MGQLIIDKPVTGSLLNDKPTSVNLLKNKPEVGIINTDTLGEVYLENKTILVGQPMGLLLALTYPTTLTFTGERS